MPLAGSFIRAPIREQWQEYHSEKEEKGPLMFGGRRSRNGFGFGSRRKSSKFKDFLRGITGKRGKSSLKNSIRRPPAKVPKVSKGKPVFKPKAKPKLKPSKPPATKSNKGKPKTATTPDSTKKKTPKSSSSPETAKKDKEKEKKKPNFFQKLKNPKATIKGVKEELKTSKGRKKWALRFAKGSAKFTLKYGPDIASLIMDMADLEDLDIIEEGKELALGTATDMVTSAMSGVQPTPKRAFTTFKSNFDERASTKARKGKSWVPYSARAIQHIRNNSDSYNEKQKRYFDRRLEGLNRQFGTGKKKKKKKKTTTKKKKTKKTKKKTKKTKKKTKKRKGGSSSRTRLYIPSSRPINTI